MKALAYIVVSFVAFASFAGTTSAQGAPSQKNDELLAKHGNDLALAKLGQAIVSHPEPLVREKLRGWIRDGSVTLYGNSTLPNLSASLEQLGGKASVVLWFNVPFVLLMPDAGNAEDKKVLLWLILYHEAVHIEDHFSGRMRLLPVIQVGPVPNDRLARTVLWDMEWSAVSKEWALAKRLHKPYLVRVIYLYTRNGETPRTFLDGFYQLQTAGEAVKLNSELAAGFTSRYKQELAKLPKR